MRAARQALSWLSVALVLSGCLGADGGETSEPAPGSSTDTATPTPSPSSTTPDPGTVPSPSGPEQIPWEILDCRFAYAQPAADAAAVAAMLPEGFTLAQAIGPRILVGFEVNLCASGTGLDGPVSPQTYASFWVPVVPPPGQGEDGAAHFVNFDVLVEDPERRALLASWGTPARDGEVEWTSPADGAVRVDYTLDGVGSFAISVAGAGPRAGGQGAFDQWTPGAAGLTYWRTDFAATQLFQGPGLLEVDAASPYADWFESPVVPATVNFGAWNYTGGSIHRPAR
jgi:hypothetical protein